jgi:hypothetical protein
VQLTVYVYIPHICVGYMPFDPTPVGIFFWQNLQARSQKVSFEGGGGRWEAVGSGADTEAIYNIGLTL